MHISFTESTEAVAHDSDPKYLRFQRLSDDPTKQGGEGVVAERLGTELALDSIGRGDVPGSTGPRVGNLTGGVTNSVTLSLQPPVRNDDLLTATSSYALQDLITGSMTTVVRYNDSTTQTFITTAADIVALAAAQGQSASQFADLQIQLPILEVGKFIESIDTQCTEAFNTADGLLNANACQFGKYSIAASSLHGVEVLTDNGYPMIVGALHNDVADNGPDVVYANEKLRFHIYLEATTAGVVEVSFIMDDASVVGPFTVTANDIKTNADATVQGAKTNFQGTFDWDTSPMVGKTAVSVRFNVTAGFSSAPYPMGAGSIIGVSRAGINGQVGTPYNIEDVTQGFPQGPYGFAPVFLFHANWVSDSSTWVNVTMDLDAATILAACSSGQLTSQSTVVEIGNSFFYPTYDGWNMGGMPFSNMVGNYGSTPAMTPPSDFAVGFSNGSSGGIFSHFNPLNVVGTWTPTSVQKVIDAGARLQVGINLYPLDVAPSYGSVVVTEPYELRQRNLPLFKLHVYGPGVGGESPPTFDVKMFGSQGTPNESNDLREWCPMNINYMNNAGLYLDNLVVHVPTDQHYPNMPDNYGGMAIWVPKEIVGPWNYIRFVLTPSEGRINSDYTNCYLTITAAARELY